jgi:hypothetical protein
MSWISRASSAGEFVDSRRVEVTDVALRIAEQDLRLAADRAWNGSETPREQQRSNYRASGHRSKIHDERDQHAKLT